MGLKSLNYSFWHLFLWGMQKSVLNYPILYQHPTRTKPFKRALKKGLLYRLNKPKPLKIFNLDRLLSLSLKP
ncbi:hypothetical protein B0X52_07605 [Helicobacter pylori]|nr:hypothetical protein B0X49_05555 [Helicobacter pylori]OOQ08022.1 hypothetical protein B0X52_07605 [Helicobacter pylori]